jgi:phosphatidylinositol-3-phosphatase
VTWRNPFVYFGSIVSASSCADDDVGISQLGTDLADGHIPSLSWIAPDLCTAGVADACSSSDMITGAAAADAFLEKWIPQIEATSAYKKDGMIVIVSDQSPASGPGADSSACCGRIHYLNTSNPGGEAQPGPGGGLVGALVISPFAATGVTDSTPADHFTLLATLENIFKLKPLGYATKRQPFDQTVFPTESGGGGAVTT